MPQEKKNSLFCCGELHRSAQYHKLKVHQQATTFTFRNHPIFHHPDVHVERDPETKSFHCPQCARRYPVASNLRDHMVFKCAGYAQYRVTSLPKIKLRSSCKSDQSEVGKPINVDAMHVDRDAGLNVKAEKVEEVIVPAADANTTQESDVTEGLRVSFSIQSLLYPESQEDDVSAVPEPEPMDVAPEPMDATPEAVSPAMSDKSGSVAAEPRAVFLPPVLRPATWSPINTATGVSEPRLISYSPSLVRSASSCSSISLRTVPDDVPGLRLRLPIKTEFDYKLESPSEDASSYSSGHQDHPPTAARVFLDGLRRPLGHAAPHLHGLGIVTEADLDLACTMPEAWDELGDLLRGSGVTMIEWLMVKDAFRTRAKRFVAPA